MGRAWKSIAPIGIGLCAAVLLAACETTHTPSNSNTSWLSTCEMDAECGRGLECLCGRCTRACSKASECTADLDGAGCEASSALGCAGDDRAEAVCVAQCERDGDCTAIASGLACRSGVCSAVIAADGGTPMRDSSVLPADGSTPPVAQDASVRVDAGAAADASVELCPDGDIVESELDCLLDDAFCFELPDGRYCTGNLTCPFPEVPLGAGDECPEGATCTVIGPEGPLICQKLPSLDFAQCRQRGGRTVLDPGDGSLFRSGCPDDRAELGSLRTENSAEPTGEGGLCCALTIADCAPQVPHYTGTCEPANRYYWAGTTCVGRTGCECIGEDCNAGAATEAECTLRYAGCRAITRACGGFVGEACADTEYCAYIQECGTVDGSSVCVPRPDACDDYLDPVCGCDGVTYGNYCSANLAGTGILRFGACN